MRRPLSVFAALVALCLLVPSPDARAQDVPPPAAPTLAQALAGAEAPRGEVYLAVGAEKTLLPKDSPSPPGVTVPQVADAYGRIVQAWETAGAIAPPTMTVLNTAPGDPNPYAGMPVDDAFKMLLGGLDDGQWKALTGDQGLGYTDLTADSQRGLFMALFPGATLAVYPQRPWGDYGASKPGTTLTAGDLQQSRLRLAQRVQIGIPAVGKNEWLDAPSGPTAGQTLYEANGGSASSGDTLYGVKIRDTVPNAPKPSDLATDAAAMRVPVALAGVRTVGDLVGRIGAALRLELYADRRYEGRSVTLVGPASARAGDLLRALALCVCGTYRKVGPAYVLTDDVMGAGARRTILQRFAGEADIARHAAVADAGDRMVTARGGVDALPALAGDLAFSAAQRAQAGKDGGGYPNGQGLQVQASLDQLTPAQQSAVRGQFGQYTSHQPAGGAGGEQLTLDRPILVMAQPTILLLAPSVPGPVEMDNAIRPYNLFQPSNKLQQQLWQQRQSQQEAAAKAAPPVKSPAPPPPPSLASLLAPLPRRAVFARPRAAADVDALIASMRRIGLNQLWLDVFSGGKSHLDGTPDILAEALAKTRGTGIAVIPTLDLLAWGADAPEASRDLTMLGETSAQAQAHRQRYEGILYQGQTPEDLAKRPAPADLLVSPAAPEVVEALAALVRRLVSTPGVAGLALTDTATVGYDRPAESHFGVQGDPLGYTPALRLAFLRRTHVDPVDLEPESYEGQMSADTSLPDFDADTPSDWKAMQDVPAQWNAFRAGTDLALMRGLLAAAQGAAGRRFPVWVRQRRPTYQGDWWGLWADPRAPLPDLSEEAANGMSGVDTNYAALARAQSRLNVFSLQSWPGESAEGLVSGLQQMKPGWDGFVLDFVGRDEGRQWTGDPLAALAKPPAPPAPAKKP